MYSRFFGVLCALPMLAAPVEAASISILFDFAVERVEDVDGGDDTNLPSSALFEDFDPDALPVFAGQLSADTPQDGGEANFTATVSLDGVPQVYTAAPLTFDLTRREITSFNRIEDACSGALPDCQTQGAATLGTDTWFRLRDWTYVDPDPETLTTDELLGILRTLGDNGDAFLLSGFAEESFASRAVLGSIVNVRLENPSIVPLPGAGVLLLAGLAGLAMTRRHKRG